MEAAETRDSFAVAAWRVAQSTPTETEVSGRLATATDGVVSTGRRQAIDFPSLADSELGSEPQPLLATATSGLPVEFEVDGACELDDEGRLVLEARGSCTVTATQPGDAEWAPAEPIEHVLRPDG